MNKTSKDLLINIHQKSSRNPILHDNFLEGYLGFFSRALSTLTSDFFCQTNKFFFGLLFEVIEKQRMWKTFGSGPYRDSFCSEIIMGIGLGEVNDDGTDLFLHIILLHETLFK